MERILVATDFSTRSDRAIRRATLIARGGGAALLLLHVVDDDQPPRIVKAEQQAALDLLREQAQTVREVDRLESECEVVLGDPFEGVVQAGERAQADLIVVGPHRRQVLRDVFVGTTAERTIRNSALPVLMANAVPAGPYRRVLVAVDLSPASADALAAVRRLGLDRGCAVWALHVFEAPAMRALSRASAAEVDIGDYREEERRRAAGDLAAFLKEADFAPARQLVELNETTVATAICQTGARLGVDLVVLGTRGRSGLRKALLGSVAEEVLRGTDRDVLAVPPKAPERG